MSPTQHAPYLSVNSLAWSNPQFAEGVAAEGITNNQLGKLLRILAFNFDLQTSATVGSRFVGYEINIGGGTVIESLTPNLNTVTNLYGICGWINGGHDTVAGSRTVNLGLPDMLIPQGGKWVAISPFKQAGDTFPLFRLAYEYV